jgi:hypothetical protein
MLFQERRVPSSSTSAKSSLSPVVDPDESIEVITKPLFNSASSILLLGKSSLVASGPLAWTRSLAINVLTQLSPLCETTASRR